MLAERPNRWIFVSKPVRPPFRDGTTVLVRSLIRALPPQLELTYFGDAADALRPGRDRIIDAPPMGYAPGMLEKARILRALASPRRLGVPLHFFFTPNRITSLVLATLRRLQPRRVMVQSVMSPVGGDLVEHLHGLDAVICASEHSRQRLHEAGLASSKLHCIHPGVEIPDDVEPRVASHRRLLYAGDLDDAVARRILSIVPLLRRPELEGWRLTVACRPKGPAHAGAREGLARRLVDDVASGRVELLSEVSDMDALLRRTSLQVFLADHVRNKVDLPLVVLEGMARGVGLVSLDFAPLSEIFERAGALGLCPGICVPPADPEALPLTLGGLMTDPTVLERIGADARDLAREAFSASAMAVRYARLYASLR